MSKYDISVCRCGRIHAISWERIHKAIELNKDILLICGGCGSTASRGADTETDWEDPSVTHYNLYRIGISPEKATVITAKAFTEDVIGKALHEIIIDPGIKVPMMTGEYARAYSNGCGFTDMVYPDLCEIEKPYVTLEDVGEFIRKYKHNRSTVNMSLFIHENSEEVLEEISHYAIDGLDWTDTKWGPKSIKPTEHFR